MHRIRRGDGSCVDFRYDREGDLVRVINPAGESHVLTRDSEGRVVGERTFDGREHRFTMDAHGRVTRMWADGGETMEVKYDLMGRIVERALPDDTTEAFTYDWAGNLLSADNGSVQCTYERDIRGRIVRETQSVGEAAETVVSTFGGNGRLHLRTSRGHEESALLNAVGAPTELLLAGAPAPLKLSYDLKGVEVERVLPGGAVLSKAFDALGRLSRRSLHDPTSLDRSAAEPEWIGRDPGLVLEQLYEYVADSFRPSRIDDTARGAIEFAHDVLGQIRKRAPAGLPSETQFSYTADGSVLDVACSREYAPGGRLIRRGLHDLPLRRRGSARREADPGRGRRPARRGVTSGMARASSRWPAPPMDGGSSTCTTRTRDGSRSASRAATRCCRGCATCGTATGSSTKRSNGRTTTATPWSTSARTPSCLARSPWSRTATRPSTGSASRLPWVYYVSEAAGRPELLIDDRAHPLAMFDAKAFGALVPLGDPTALGTATSARFAGHWEDEETGLFYNRWRFLDPETGLYLSPEPAGLMGGLHPYRYANNRPLDAFDPDGLMICAGTPGIPCAVNNQNPIGNENGGTPLNPIVQANLANPPQNGFMNPGGCAEPRYLSDHLNSYTPPITNKW